MQADRLDTRARLAQRCRQVVIALKAFGVADNDIRGKNLFELEEMHRHEIERAMAAPTGR